MPSSCIAYLARGPVGTRFAGVVLRIVAYSLVNYPEPSRLKVVIQSMEAGRPIVESPLTEAFLAPLELAAYLSESLRDGWDVVPYSKEAACGTAA